MSARLVWGALTLAALAGALLWVWKRPAESGEPVTIAVLPFDNLTGAAETDYLASGLTEDTIVSLGRIDPERVSVIGRTSMIAYRGTTKSLAQIGRELGTDRGPELLVVPHADRLARRGLSRSRCRQHRDREQCRCH